MKKFKTLKSLLRRSYWCLVVWSLFFGLVAPLIAVEDNQVTQDPVKVQRLAGLAKLWGVVKYFHPYLAYKDINWDKALIETIPKVESANSKAEYRAAIEFLLSFLHDPNTRLVSTGEPAPHPPSGASSQPSQPFIHWTDDNIAVIVANDYPQFSGSLEKAATFKKLFEEAKKAKAIVFDVRNKYGSTDEDLTFWFTADFLQAFPTLLSRDLPLSATRYRMFSGYPTQTGGAYTGYFSAFVNTDAGLMRAQGKETTPVPMIFLVNDRTGGIQDVLGGLQSAHLGVVILEGKAGMESGITPYVMKLPEEISVAVRTNELLNPDGSLGFTPDLEVPIPNASSEETDPSVQEALEVARGNRHPEPKNRTMAMSAASQKLEDSYKGMSYPSRQYRMLALFRFWNVINYFFPYKHLIGRPWDEVLPELIPQFEGAGDELQYNLAVAQLVRQIHDTHGFINSPVLTKYVGNYFPPIEVKSVQRKTVVTYIFDENIGKTTGLRVGDVIVSVDGEDIGARRERLGNIFSASTPQALRWRVDRAVLGGPQNSAIKLGIQNAEGNTIEVSLTRSMPPKKSNRPYQVYSILPSGYGYIDLERLSPQEVDAAFEKLKDTPAIIFDDRGYPKGTFPLLGAHLTSEEVVAARFETPTPQSPDLTQESRVKFVQMADPGSKPPYKGKVVVLINEEAISQSEHTCLFLEATGHAMFVGSPTNGANGDVTQTVLPGGITVNFSGHDVRHADGRQLQRKGIQPDVRVEPTLEGVRAGRDEILEAAVEYLQKSGIK